MNKKIHFISLGCARNLVDTEVMMGITLRAGYEAISDVTNADVLVMNTCGFLEAARNEAFEILDEVFREKKGDAKVVITGCMVGLHRGELEKRFPNIHFFLGSGDVEKIIDAIEAEEKGSVIGDAKSYLQQGEIPRFVSTPKHYAYLKIAEGCKKRCSFCIIPVIKGKLQSKSVSQVLKEAKSLIASGVQELILIAQDLGDYGKDRGERNGLYQLLKEMVKIEGEFWIRLLYLYPDEITDEIQTLMKEEKKICSYIDMPIQHINNDVLKRMHRKTSGDQIRTTLTSLRKEIPGIVIRTSLMVGFPGETEEQFKELEAFVTEAKLDNVGIFKYSKESQSHSATLDGHLDDNVKEERFQRLVHAQKSAVERLQEKYLGRRLKVLVDGYHPETDNLLVGRFYGQCPEIDGQVILSDWRQVSEFGKFYEVEITDFAGYDLIGRAIRAANEKKKPSLNVIYR